MDQTCIVGNNQRSHIYIYIYKIWDEQLTQN